MKLFGIEIDEREREEIFRDIRGRIERNERAFVVTANALIMLKVAKLPEYRKAIEKADLVIPDGSGIVLVSKLRGRRVHKYPGVELAVDLLKEGKKKGWSFYLLGAREEVVGKLAKKLRENGINVVGYHHGYFKGDGPLEEMRERKPDVVFVAMGAPKQEMWIARNLDSFEKGIFLGVGGTFDVLSGCKRRAPEWMVKMGLEWLYRIFQEPSRRWKVPFELAEFLIRALWEGMR